MANLTVLVGELEAMQERLRSTAVVLRGEPVSVQLEDGTTIQGSTGDVTSARNPDGPAAADAIDKAIATLKAQREALEPFAAMRLSTEPEISDCVHRSAGAEMRRRADAMDKRDDDIRRARASIEGNPTA